MQVGIIGAGNVGSALSKASTRAGHRVTITAEDQDEAKRVAELVGAKAVTTNRDAVVPADIAILAVPFGAVPAIITELGPALDGKVVIEVSNKFDPNELTGKSNAELAQEMAPGAKVVKAFNTILAAHQADPQIDGVQLDGYVAADDTAARATVLEFVESLGFKPIDCGPLAMARALEGMGLLNIYLNMTHRWPWQTGWKLLGPTG